MKRPCRTKEGGRSRWHGWSDTAVRPWPNFIDVDLEPLLGRLLAMLDVAVARDRPLTFA